MLARLVKDRKGNVKLLFKNGTYSNSSSPVLANLVLNFQTLTGFEGIDGEWIDSVQDMSLYPGTTLAMVTDTHQLIIYDGSVFFECFDSTLQIKEFLTVDEFSSLHNKSNEIIKVYCRDGRIQGAQKIGNVWMIPKDAPYPVPARRQRPKTCGPRPKK